MINQILIENITIEDFKISLREIVKEELINHIPKEIKYLTRKEMALKLRVSLPTIDKMIGKGKLKAYRVCGRILFKESEIILSEIVIRKRY